jgi:hypothetical protein
MAIFYIILRNDAVVLDPLFCEEVNGVGFLQKRITDVLFVPQDLIYVACMPAFSARTVKDTIRFQTASDFQHTGTLKVFPVNALDDFSFLRHNHQTLVFILGIAEKPSAVDLDFTLLIAIL